MYNDWTQNAPMTGGGGVNWGGVAGGIASGLGGLIGGNMMGNAYDSYGNQVNQGMDKQNQLYDQGLGYYQPYYDQGTNAFNKYGQAIDRMSNPSQYVSDIYNGYSQSPMAAFQMQEGMRAGNNAAAASGQLGSPAEQMAMQRYAQGVSSQDMQRWYDNVNGANNTYLGGLGNQASTGFGAAERMAGNRQGLADNLAELLQNLGMSQTNASASRSGGIGDLIGGALGVAGGFGLF